MLPKTVVRNKKNGIKIKKEVKEPVTKLFDQSEDKRWNWIKELKVQSIIFK